MCPRRASPPTPGLERQPRAPGGRRGELRSRPLPALSALLLWLTLATVAHSQTSPVATHNGRGFWVDPGAVEAKVLEGRELTETEAILHSLWDAPAQWRGCSHSWPTTLGEPVPLFNVYCESAAIGAFEVLSVQHGFYVEPLWQEEGALPAALVEAIDLEWWKGERPLSPASTVRLVVPEAHGFLGKSRFCATLADRGPMLAQGDRLLLALSDDEKGALASGKTLAVRSWHLIESKCRPDPADAEPTAGRQEAASGPCVYWGLSGGSGGLLEDLWRDLVQPRNYCQPPR